MGIFEVQLVSPKHYDGYTGSGDTFIWKDYKTKKAALNYAKKTSLKESVNGEELYAVWVQEDDEDGDMVEQWTFEKGEITYHTTQ